MELLRLTKKQKIEMLRSHKKQKKMELLRLHKKQKIELLRLHKKQISLEQTIPMAYYPFTTTSLALSKWSVIIN